jgi:holo-[acyl-carrier protein] synthase
LWTRRDHDVSVKRISDVSHPLPKLLIGVDLVSIDHIEQLLDNHPKRFREYAFTESEQDYCEAQADPARHYSARWAAKEAFVKATGTGETVVDLTVIEVIRDSNGPGIELKTNGEQMVNRILPSTMEWDVVRKSVSLSHSRDAGLAVATVVLLVPIS